jgi:hypothetical protein
MKTKNPDGLLAFDELNPKQKEKAIENFIEKESGNYPDEWTEIEISEYLSDVPYLYKPNF